MFLCRFITCKLEVVFQLKLTLRIALSRLEVHDQAVFHSKSNVIVDILVSTVEDLSDQRFVPWCGQYEVDVCWSPRMSVKELQELSCWAIVWDRILCWP